MFWDFLNAWNMYHPRQSLASGHCTILKINLRSGKELDLKSIQPLHFVKYLAFVHWPEALLSDSKTFSCRKCLKFVNNMRDTPIRIHFKINYSQRGLRYIAPYKYKSLQQRLMWDDYKSLRFHWWITECENSKTTILGPFISDLGNYWPTLQREFNPIKIQQMTVLPRDKLLRLTHFIHLALSVCLVSEFEKIFSCILLCGLIH